MGRQSIGFYCGPADHGALLSFIKSVGLYTVPVLWDQEVPDDPAQHPFCYLSPVPKSQLHPYKSYDDELQISAAIDPLISFMRAYFKNPYLVSGQLRWCDDNPELGAKTRFAYSALVTWIRREWEKVAPRSEFYRGPDAKRLVALGAHEVFMLPEKGAHLNVVVYGGSAPES